MTESFIFEKHMTLMGRKKEAKSSRKSCERGVCGDLYLANPYMIRYVKSHAMHYINMFLKIEDVFLTGRQKVKAMNPQAWKTLIQSMIHDTP